MCVCARACVTIGEDAVTMWGSNRNRQRGLLELTGVCMCVCVCMCVNVCECV